MMASCLRAWTGVPNAEIGEARSKLVAPEGVEPNTVKQLPLGER